MKMKRFAGDVAIGHNLAAGGDASIEGSMRVSHDLCVEGRLEARAFRGCDRGLFLTAEALEKAYPIAENGWWALVGDTLPAAVYVAVDGRWMPTGKKAGGTVTVASGNGPGGAAMFSGEWEGTDLEEGATAQSSVSEGCHVSWSPALGSFLLITSEGAYSAWTDEYLYADDSHTPHRNCLYVDVSTNNIYRYEAPDLVLVC